MAAFREFRRSAILVVAELVCIAAGGRAACAQTDAADKPITTLRVFENLIQIPVVVLGPTMELMKPVAAKQFFISIDSGPPFQATHVRFEGDDPIALSVLIDLDSYSGGTTDEFGDAIGQLSTKGFLGQDRISIYALRGCEVWRRSYNAVPDAAVQAKQIVGIRQNWPGGGGKRADPKCQRRLPLLDALAQVIEQGSVLPGRRAVLVLSDGEDRESRRSWTQVSLSAIESGTAVFGLKNSPVDVDGFVSIDDTFESPYRNLCESTGGLEFSASSPGFKRKLREFLELLRKRYIVEFPRPDDAEGGKHSMQVTIARMNPFIRAAGISVPVADPKMLADPNTVRVDPALAPQVGKRKPLGSGP